MHIIRPRTYTTKEDARRMWEHNLNQKILGEEEEKTRNAYKEYVCQQNEKNPGKTRRLGIKVWANKYYKEYHIRPGSLDYYFEDNLALYMWLLSEEFRAIKKILLRRKENKPLTTKDRQAFRYLWAKGLMQGGEPGDKDGPIIPLPHIGRKRKVEEVVSKINDKAKPLLSNARFWELYKAAVTGSPDKVSPVTVSTVKRARAAFKEAFKRFYFPPEGNVEAKRNLGVIYHRIGWYQEAVDMLRKAIHIEPDNIKAHYFLGLSYVGLKVTGLALEEYKILKSLDPEFAEELFNKIHK